MSSGLLSSATAMMAQAAAGMYLIGTSKAGAMLGPLPLYTISKMSFATSNKALKFRAHGPVFLAYQAGEFEGVAIDITCEFVGPFKWLYLTLLKRLFIYTRAQVKPYLVPTTPGKLIPILGMINFAGTNYYQIASNTYISANKVQTGGISGASTEGVTKFNQRNFYYHNTFMFISKMVVIPQAYIESMIINQEATTNDKISVSLLLREYKAPDSWSDFTITSGVESRNKPNAGRLILSDEYQLYIYLNTAMSTLATGMEASRVGVMRKLSVGDLLREDPITGRIMRMFGSDPMPNEVVRDLLPNIPIYDPLENEDAEPIDVTDWNYFDFTVETFPFDKSIDTTEFDGKHVYSLLFELTTEIPLNQVGYNEYTSYVICIVKDEEGTITDRFVISPGLLYRIGDGKIKICFDQLELHYCPTIESKLYHVITGRWTYD